MIPSLDPADGGPSVVFPRMLAALTAAGVAVEGATTAAVAAGDAGADLPIRRFRRNLEPGKPSVALLRWLARHVGRYDLVHVHAVFSFASDVAAWLARRRGVPYVIRPLGVLNRYGMTMRRPWLKRSYLRLLAGPLLRDAAAVHFTSQAEADEASELGIPMRGVVIPLGIDLQRRGDPERMFSRYPALRGSRVLLFLARLDPKKNLEALIEAFAALAADDAALRLLVCGDGDEAYVDSLRTLAEQRGVGARIVWAGAVSGEDKASAFAVADLFVLPSHSENFGIAVVEAMAARLPVVVSDRVPLAARIVETQAGWRCGTDASSVIKALESALDPAVDRREIGARAFALVESEYSIQAMGQRLKALYEAILAGHRPR